MDTSLRSATRYTSIRKLHSDDRGLSTVEYVIILVLIAAAAVAAWTTLGSTITGKIKDSNSAIAPIHT